MSIDFGSDINHTLGRNLPIPYIDKVKIYNNYMDIQLAVYFNVSVDQNINTYLDDLSEIKFYCMPLLGGHTTRTDAYSGDTTLIDANGRIDPAKRIVSGKENLLKYVPSLQDTFIVQSTLELGGSDVFYADSTIEVFPRYRVNSGVYTYWAMQQSISDFKPASIQIVGQQKIHKYVTNVSLRYNLWNDYSFWEPNLEFLKAIKANLTLFGFSAAIELNVDDFYTDIQASILNETGLGDLYKASMSGVSHQLVMENGSVADEPIVIYTQDDGSHYYGPPIQTIDGVFYTTETVTLDRIASSFSQFIGSVVEADFQQAINSLAYIIATYKASSELLIKLNEYRVTFPTGLSDTSLGRWYEKVAGTIFRLNKQIKQDEKALIRNIVTSPVVIDLRDVSSLRLGWDPPELPDVASSLDEDYVYTKNMLMHRNGIFDGNNPDAQAVESFASEESYVSFDEGFVLFDYEKAIRTQSVLSKVFDVSKIEQWFGRSCTNEHFKLDNIMLWRYQWDGAVPSTYEGGPIPSDGSSRLFGHTTMFSDSLEESYPRMEASYLYNDTGGDGLDTDTVKTSFEVTYTEPAMNTVTYYPKLILRNFNTSGDMGDYRMMCFQTSHIIASGGAYHKNNRDNDMIFIELDCRDYTKEIYVKLLEEYILAAFELESYLSAASEFCSYNNTDGYFNNFFSIAMTTQYPDPTTAPWILAPLLYNFHLDLLYNMWAGDRDTIVSEAIKISELISPEVGDLEFLQQFVENVQSLFNTHYGSSGAVEAIIGSYSANEQLTFGGNKNVFYPLPDVDFQNLVQTYTTEDYMMDLIQGYYDKIWESVKHYMYQLMVFRDDGASEGEANEVELPLLYDALFVKDKRRDNETSPFPWIYDTLRTYGHIDDEPLSTTEAVRAVQFTRVADYLAANNFVANTLKASDAIQIFNDSNQSGKTGAGNEAANYWVGDPPDDPPGSEIAILADILLNYFNPNKVEDLSDGSTMEHFFTTVFLNTY